jgi:hypothetical protein
MMGSVAAIAHQKGKIRSENRPKSEKEVQKIFLCMKLF